MRKPTFSPTKLTTYLTCRIKYHWAYMTPYGRWMRRPNPAFAFGANLHRALEYFHTAGGAEKLSPDEFRHALDSLWSDAGFETAQQSEAFKQRGHEIASRVLRSAGGAAHLKPSCCSRSGRCGAIWDATSSRGALIASMNTPTARWRLSTTKAGALMIDEEQVRNDLALHCYALLLQEIYPDRPLWIAIYALRPNKKVAVLLDADALVEFRDLLDALVAQILDEDWDLLAPRWIPHCAGCEFLELCVRKLGLNPAE
jgi:putative RecB family exonuclease